MNRGRETSPSSDVRDAASAPRAARPDPVAFERDVELVLGQIRGVFSAVVEAVCGGGVKAHEVADRFGVHRKLGWQVWNVAYAQDTLHALRHMPSPRSLEAWQVAAAERAVPPDLLSRLDEVAQAFERLIETHAEDRDLLELMIDACDPRPDEASEVRWRKQSFIGNSFIWGVRARTLHAAVFLHPAKRAGFFDLVRVHGLYGLIRTRPNVRWPFAQSIVQTDDGREWRPAREPIADVPGGGTPLMADFCSRPLPPVERRTGEGGLVEDELQPGPVGQVGECTLVTGEWLRDVAPVQRTTADEFALFGAGVRTPGETLICDHFVHRGLFPAVRDELYVFSELHAPMTRDERDRLVVAERLQSLGPGLARIRTAELPRYAELVATVLARTGWRADEFDVYRVRMRYPPMPAGVMVRYEMWEGAPG